MYTHAHDLFFRKAKRSPMKLLTTRSSGSLASCLSVVQWISLFALFFGACHQPKIVNDQQKRSPIDTPGFEVNFDLRQVNEQELMLSIKLSLDSANFVISPFSTDSFYGHLAFTFEQQQMLIPNGELQIHCPRKYLTRLFPGPFDLSKRIPLIGNHSK